MTLKYAFDPGDRVIIAGDIPAIVDEVVFSRGSPRPFYEVTYWNEGRMIRLRLHEDDLAEGKP
jgi:hypothetical protein